jgi:D-alanyl-D-alanine dipeptidase
MAYGMINGGNLFETKQDATVNKLNKANDLKSTASLIGGLGSIYSTIETTKAQKKVLENDARNAERQAATIIPNLDADINAMTAQFEMGRASFESSFAGSGFLMSSQSAQDSIAISQKNMGNDIQKTRENAQTNYYNLMQQAADARAAAKQLQKSSNISIGFNVLTTGLQVASNYY